MALTGFIPSIRLEGDEERALALIPEGKLLMDKVIRVRELSGVQTFSMNRRVSDDSTIYALSTGSNNIIQISVAVHTPEQTHKLDIDATSKLPPDFYSGVIFGGNLVSQTRTGSDGKPVTYDVLNTFAPTPTCKDTHKELVMGRQQVARLAVKPFSEFGDLNAPDTNPRVFSQYTKLRPSMYSGTMKKVVQVVMGLGRTGAAKLRDPTKHLPDTKYMKDVESKGVQVRYDWRFMRTHGITKAADGKLWLIEISRARGVLAMPLKCFPGTDTEAFKHAAENGHDHAMAKAIDELGCLPTGEVFPTDTTTLQNQINAGNILKLLDAHALDPFYNSTAYSSYMGWAFSDSGVEAHNTGYYFDPQGYQKGVWYQINIHIGATKTIRLPNEALANATAELRKEREGYIWTDFFARGTSRYLPVKFYEPLINGLINHEGSPNTPLPAVKCDTPMLVFFANGELKVASYYSNPKADTYNNIDDPTYPGECLLGGDWTITQTAGSRSFPPMMYTNDFDDRQVLSAEVTTTTIKSEDKGYDNPVVSDFILSPDTSHITRSRIFKRTTTQDQRLNPRLSANVVWPQFSREAYYYAVQSLFEHHSGSVTITYDTVTDPNTAYAWRCFVHGFNAFPPDRPDCNTEQCRGDGGCRDAVGVPKERRVVCLTYEPSDSCYEFADSGPWLQLCENMDPYVSLAPLPKPTSTSSFDNGADPHQNLYLISNGNGGPLAIPITASQYTNHWAAISPDPITGVTQFISCEHSAIGEDMLVYNTGLSTYTGDIKKIGYTPEPFVANDGFPTFVGVNQP